MSSNSPPESSVTEVGEITEETAGVEEKIHVMVGTDVRESISSLKWTLQNFHGKKICICHVHQPAQKITIMGAKFSISEVEEKKLRALHVAEKEEMYKILDDYNTICTQMGIVPENLVIDMDSIEKGIVQLISQHCITKLVMGAAADKFYSRRMREPKSKKAIYVRRKAPTFCDIWFVCNGDIICRREAVKVTSMPIQASQITKSLSVTALRNHAQLHINISELRRGRSENHNKGIQLFRRLSNRIEIDRELINDVMSFENCECSSKRDSSCSPPSSYRKGESIRSLEPNALHMFDEVQPHLSPQNVLNGDTDNNRLFDQLEKLISEAESSRIEAHVESMRRWKAEKDAIEAIRNVKASESMYAEEVKQRKCIDEALAKGKEEIEGLKKQINELNEELQIAEEQKSCVERKIETSEKQMQELEENLVSERKMLQNHRKERDELLSERDNALKIAMNMRRIEMKATSNTSIPFFPVFSLSEIIEATNNFDPSFKIGEGGYGNIYKCIFRQTKVAIKTLRNHSSQGPSEFQQEVNILSKLRHPNLVTLIGSCPEAWILMYEYLPNGSLEDRLNCKDNTPPLSWKTRIRIAIELCSVLIFLHSSGAQSIVHGDLKPSNILLDANYVSKLSDFGICRVIPRNEFLGSNSTIFCRTDPKGTFAYIDPEFMETGEMTPKSDVYSFGVILLRLLTGKPAKGIKKEVQYALENENLRSLLDVTAGDWPFEQAKQLARLAMRCCEINRKGRPDLASEVWKILEPMIPASREFSFFQHSDSKNHSQIPPSFICPILQKIMRQPLVAADGFSYEAEALRKWLESGHKSSPITKLNLAHYNLMPNLALQSAIQEWLQQV